MLDDNVPIIDFSDDEINAIRLNLGLPDDEVKPGTPQPVVVPSNRRKKGTAAAPTPVEDSPLPPAQLTKRDEREVNNRMQNILEGATGILGNVRPYLAMTEEEAKAISEPLSSYLVRNADVIPVAHQVLENYDLAAITIGVASYVARVYSDRRAEIEERRSSNVSPIDRVRTIPTLDEESSQIRSNPFISHSDVAGGRSGL